MEKKTILVVEDDGILRDLIKGAFERQYHVREAANCHEAIKQTEHPIDLALIDYSLPDGNGFAVLTALRKAKPEMPVIMMTAYSTESLAINAFRSGVVDYLKKPFTFAYLREKFSELLKGTTSGGQSEDAVSSEVFVMDCIGALIEDNYASDLTRDRLARKACMDKYRFSKVFNDRFGRSVSAHVNSVRIRKAAELLKNNDLSIADVAFSVGYKSIPHFSRVFRKTYGVPPKEFKSKQLLI